MDPNYISGAPVKKTEDVPDELGIHQLYYSTPGDPGISLSGCLGGIEADPFYLFSRFDVLCQNHADQVNGMAFLVFFPLFPLFQSDLLCHHHYVVEVTCPSHVLAVVVVDCLYDGDNLVSVFLGSLAHFWLFDVHTDHHVAKIRNHLMVVLQFHACLGGHIGLNDTCLSRVVVPSPLEEEGVGTDHLHLHPLAIR